MSALTVRIATTLEYLGPYMEQGKPFWGISVSVGIDGDEAVADLDLVKGLLRPWAWKQVSFRLFLTNENSQPRAVLTDPPSKIPKRNTAILNGRMQRAFENTLNADSDFSKGLFKWTPNDQPDASHIHADIHQPPWPAVLAQLGQFPYPIPHVLNLCWFFQATLPKDGDEKYVMALPSFSIGGRTFDFDQDPVSTIPNASAALVRKYADATISVYGYCNALVRANLADPAPRTDPAGCLDANDPYVPVRAIFDSDWISQLPSRSGEAFDLAQRLIDAMRALSLDRASKPELLRSLLDKIPPLRDAIVRSLYDLADTGIDPAPDGGSIYGQAALGFTGDISTFPQLLRNYQGTKTNSVASIRETFKTVSEVAHVPAIDLLASSQAPTLVQAGGRSPQMTDDSDLRRLLATEVQSLDVLQSVFSREETLGALLAAQWTEALSVVPAALGPARDEFLGKARGQLAGLQLRRQYAMSNLGRYWPELTRLGRGEKDERQKLRENFVEVMRVAVTTRIGTLAGEAIGKALIDSVMAWANYFAASQLLPESEFSPKPSGKGVPPAPPPSPTVENVPHGISVQADCLYTFPASEEQSDVARHTSGFCIFMRDRSQGGDQALWRSLNLARPRFFPIKQDEPVAEWETVLVPFPIQDEGSIRQALVTYNNHPLLAISPASKLGDPADSLGAASQSTPPPIVQYANAYGQGKDEWAKLPPLVFGRTYDFMLGRVRNCGALPRAVASSSNPAELTDSSKVRINKLLKNYIGSVRYLRRVPIGALRFAPATGKRFNDRLKWGAAIKGVQPRALEAAPETSEIYDASGATKWKGNSDPNSSVPVLLLDKTPQSFKLYPPTIDINTWDRWVAGPKSVAELRKRVWTTVHENMRRKVQAETESDALVLEDPAISEVIVIELIADGNSQRVSTSWQRKPLALGVGSLTTPGITVQGVPASKDEGPKLKIEQGRIIASVPEGKIAYLHIYGTIEAKDRDRFLQNVISGKSLDGMRIDSHDQAVAPIWKNLYLLPACSVAIETVSAALPEAADIRIALDASYVDGRLQVTLKRDEKSVGFMNVGRVEILRQKWHWDGRPFWDEKGKVTTFPIETFEVRANGKPSSTPLHPSLLNWEVQTFTPRTDYEVLSTRLRRSGSEVHFERSDDISAEPQATFYRFGARVWSRYAPLLRSPQQSVDSSNVGPDALDEWKRVFVPCRWAKKVPPPHIQMILPLTESAANDSSDFGVSGLLIVIEGPWYTIGGLTEELECSIATTQKRPTVPLEKPIVVQEIGPDATKTTSPADEGGYSLRDLIGPVGHTLEESDVAPLFVNTSFVLPGPRPKIDSFSNLSWFFGKVKFARTLKRTDGASFGVRERSDSTDAFWVQFLPRFVFESGDHKLIGDGTTIELNADGTTLILRNGNDPVTVSRSADEQATSRLYGVLTGSVQDVGGRLQQERYLGLFTFQGTEWHSADPIDAGESALLFRIIEVEIPPKNKALLGSPKPISLGTLWDELFPREGGDGPRDSGARVIRVSRPLGGAGFEGSVHR